MNPKFTKGQVVKLVNSDKVGVICEEPKIIAGEVHYAVFIEGSQKTYSELSLELVAKTSNDLTSSIKNNEFSNLKDFLSYLTYIKIERPLSNNLYAFLSSRTEFLIHQFKPILKYLNSPYQRLLIADEVGVGKTIEAGVIYTELLSRHRMRNALIICPSGLRFKWQKEMRKRFSEEFGILHSKDIKVFFKKFERNPNGVNIKAIASIQTLRNEEILENLERLQIPWDFILVDEAHHLRNEGTKSNSLGKILSNTADSMILMSATPLQLGNRDLFNLLRIMLPEEFDNFDTFEQQVKPNEFINMALLMLSKKEDCNKILDSLTLVEGTSQRERFLSNPNYVSAKTILQSERVLSRDTIISLQKKLSELNVLSNIYTRTKKKEISVDSPIREPVTIKVEFTEAEMQYYKRVADLIMTLNPGVPPGFLLQMPLRQVASCIPASIQYLNDIATSGIIALEQEELADDLDESEEISLTASDINLIKETVEYGKENLNFPDSKTETFLKTIEEIFKNGSVEKMIIFSFFKRTLKYLEKELKKLNISTARIDGDVPFIEREEIFEKFSKPDGYQILLSSEVGGEGLDMQFCNCMMNYDLPWNPMRVEQRIGRLDRYGQKHPKIHIYNFSVEGTIESNIFLRLCNRIGVFEQYIGELEPILGEVMRQLSQEIINTELTSEQQKEKADQIALVIEKRKKELEIFDLDRKKFLGQDQYFTEEISNIKKEERFITPLEIKNLVESFIKDNFPKSKISLEDKNSQIYIVKPDEEFKEFVRDYIFGEQEVSTEFSEHFLELLSQDSFKITFDYRVANENPHIEFITLRHKLITSIIKYYSKKEVDIATQIEYTGSLASNLGSYAFFIYLLEIKSYTKSLTFIPVVIDLNTNEVSTELSDNIFKILKESKDSSESQPTDIDNVHTAEERAILHVVEQKKSKQKELLEVNESLINDRLSSLKQTHEYRILNIEKIIERLKESQSEKSNKVILMKESQKVNLIRNYERKKAALEEDKKVIVSHEFICGGILNVN
ncbi:DEAD/DEAH box helicase family protein [Candidatus Woesearchaeota archaeon]|nr:DEAD/DEAH box helicase family protein [Candidatus Woesearchaeota archaeon]